MMAKRNFSRAVVRQAARLAPQLQTGQCGCGCQKPLLTAASHYLRGHNFIFYRRLAAVRAGVPTDWRRCYYCGKYDDPRQLYEWGKGGQQQHYHRRCHARYAARLRERHKTETV